MGKYHYYVIMPHFYEHVGTIMETIKKIPANKLVILDKNIEKCFNKSAAISQDFENDINIALHSAIDLLYKHKKIVLVYPTDVHYPFEIVKSFQKFCQETIFEYRVID